MYIMCIYSGHGCELTSFTINLIHVIILNIISLDVLSIVSL